MRGLGTLLGESWGTSYHDPTGETWKRKGCWRGEETRERWTAEGLKPLLHSPPLTTAVKHLACQSFEDSSVIRRRG